MADALTKYLNDNFGIITGTFLLSRFPNVPGEIARLKARSGNAGSAFLGYQANTGSFLMPWELDANDDTDWFVLKDGNLNSLYQRGSSGSSYISYWVRG